MLTHSPSVHMHFFVGASSMAIPIRSMPITARRITQKLAAQTDARLLANPEEQTKTAQAPFGPLSHPIVALSLGNMFWLAT